MTIPSKKTQNEKPQKGKWPPSPDEVYTDAEAHYVKRCNSGV